MKKASVWVLLLLFVTAPLGAVAGLQEKVDLNQADSRSLQSLPGIGPALAQRILDHRQKNGPFRRIEDLMNVRGIGTKKFEALEKYLTVGAPATAPGAPGKGTGTRPPR